MVHGNVTCVQCTSLLFWLLTATCFCFVTSGDIVRFMLAFATSCRSDMICLMKPYKSRVLFFSNKSQPFPTFLSHGFTCGAPAMEEQLRCWHLWRLEPKFVGFCVFALTIFAASFFWKPTTVNFLGCFKTPSFPPRWKARPRQPASLETNGPRFALKKNGWSCWGGAEVDPAQIQGRCWLL